MDATIVLFLIQDGITNGAIYALLGLALVLVFAVTRVIFIPQGEFVAYGAMTYGALEMGKVPGTVWLLLLFGGAAWVFELWSCRRRLTAASIVGEAAKTLLLPVAILLFASWLAPVKAGPAVNLFLTLAIIVPMGPYLYRFAFQPLADASILTLLIASVGIHLALMGLGLVFFGAEGQRAQALYSTAFSLGPMVVSGQSIAVYLIALGLIAGLYLFFEHSLYGKALRATAVNRLGARLVGVRTSLSGRIAFGLAVAIGAISGILIAPFTTLYYDSGFLIGLKGFVAAIVGGLASYPITAISAVLVGIVEAFGAFGASSVKEIIVFTLIIPVLIWRSLRMLHIEEEE